MARIDRDKLKQQLTQEQQLFIQNHPKSRAAFEKAASASAWHATSPAAKKSWSTTTAITVR